MAKNRNSERGKQSQQAADGGSHGGADAATAQKPDSRITPPETGHKGRSRRFGHN